MASSATGNVRVLVRVRPLNNAELTEHGSCGRSNVLSVEANANGEINFNGENKENGGSIVINSASDSRNSEIGKQFTFDAVHGEHSTQSEVYNSVKGIVDAVVEGYNGTIVAYGQTGSGKTHTVFGSGVRGDHNGVGIVQRSLRDIFSRFSQVQAQNVGDNPGTSGKTTFRGSFVEIFNERVYDLLSPETLDNNLQVRENVRGGGVYIEGLKEVELQNTAEAEALMSAALANRHVASTNMNRTSSRSHAMFVLSVRTEHVDEDGLRKVRSSKFTLVDLAGSERQKTTGTTGNRLKEASMINKSLLCLGEVINKLVDREHGKSRHIPFRNSKLTFLLKDTWGGNSKTCLVATVSPSAYAQSETLSTLQFAQRAKLVKNNAVLNEDTCGTVAALQAELARLQSELKGNNAVGLDNCPTSDQDTLLSLKRQNKRKEKKIDELQRVLEEERNLCNTLKRKLQEESFSRKLKERRLENVERKNKDVTESEQVEMLKMEIKSLQQRLDAPSEDAIKWRVAYEEAQDALEEKMKYASDDVDIVALEERNSSLEETVDRLLAEKLDLESKVADLTESSNETQQEIDSIMNEVDILEKEMHDLQDQLEIKSQEYEIEKGKSKKSEEQIQSLTSDLDLSTKRKEELEKNVSELQDYINNLTQEISTAHAALKEKDDTLSEIEELLEQKERDFESKIEYLKKELEESNNGIKERDDLIAALNDRVNSSSNDSECKNAHLQSALQDLECEKAKVVELQNRINSLMADNEKEIDIVNKNHKKAEEEYQFRITDMENKIKELNEEILTQHSIMDEVKRQLLETQQSLKEKEQSIIDYEELSKDSNSLEKELVGEISELKKAIDESKCALEQNIMKLQHSQEQKEKLESTIKQYEMEAALHVSNVDALRDDLDRLVEEKEHLQKALESQQMSQKDVSEEVISLQKKLEMSENLMKSMAESHASTVSDLRSSKEESQRKHLEALFGMESEQKNLQKEMCRLSEALKASEEKTSLLSENIQEKDDTIDRLKLQISHYESSLNQLNSDTESEVSRLTEEILQLQKRCDETQSQLTRKGEELNDITRELVDSKKSSDILKVKLECIVEEQQQMKSKHDEKTTHDQEIIQRITKEKESLEEKCEGLKQQMSTFTNIQQHCQVLEKENRKLHSECEMCHKSAQENAQKFESIEKMASDSMAKLELTIDEKNKEIEALKENMYKIDEDISADKDVALKKLEHTVKRLNSEKEDLEFQLDSLREDQDVTLEESREFQNQIAILKTENEELKRLVMDLRASTDSSTVATESTSMVSTGSTWASDNRLSYGTSDMEAARQECPKNQSIQKSPILDEAAGVDESFDEDNFLPDDFLPNVDDDASPVVTNELVNQASAGDISCSTPLRTGDYGKRRAPLSDRKNTMTPHKSTSKKLKSTSKFMASARKLMSSSKKKKDSDYMVFNNKRLFGE